MFRDPDSISRADDLLARERSARKKAEADRDEALSAMWGMICVATNRDNQTAEWRGLASIYLDRIFQERQEHWNELDRLRASVSLQARDGH